MIRFSKEKVKLLHKMIAQETGGSIGIRMDCTNEDVATVGLALAAGSMGYEELLAWVREHRLY